MSDPWTPEPRTYESWSIERAGSTRRITEDGPAPSQARLRITQQGNIRIIERFPFTWDVEGGSTDPWKKE